MTIDPKAEPADDGLIRRRLLSPAESLPLSELSKRWFVQTIEVTVAGYGKLARDYG